MMKYRLINDRQCYGNESNRYVERGADILELPTGYTVAEALPYKKAKDLCRHLNFGGGFDGWTPAFFLQKTIHCYPETHEVL